MTNALYLVERPLHTTMTRHPVHVQTAKTRKKGRLRKEHMARSITQESQNVILVGYLVVRVDVLLVNGL